jgi:hypothetical protein
MVAFRNTSEFKPTVGAAAERLNISATAIEKDYWVSEVLRALAAKHYGDFVFKGGTSLSKGFRIVERFSEDVDILILNDGASRGKTDRLMKEMGRAAAEGVGGSLVPVGSSETGRHRSYEVAYPTSNAPTTLISTTVLLEMGVRGGPQPHESVAIGSLLGDLLEAAGTATGEFSDLRPFEILALHPGRTLLEKFVLVHELSKKTEDELANVMIGRIGRHFYDIYELLDDTRVLELLANRELVSEVLESVTSINRTYFGAGEKENVRPSGGFATSRVFDPNSEVSRRLQTAYEETMPELYFGRDPLPSWEQICDRVTAKSELL